ncbi:HET-domain-containing protein, partial [Ophiobolus disseminans]
MEKFNATSPSPLWSDHPLFGEPSFTPDEDLVPPRDCRTPEVPWAPRYVNQIREWIEACNKLHGNACVPEPVPRRPPEDVPLWLIDTDEQRIVPGLSAHRYLALSYVWPESRGSADSAAAPPPRTLLLDNASVADFQQSGFLGSPDTEQRIPAVIRHAIEFTCALGERYLWVDRLCIVQDDVGDGGTLSQVGKMDKIYSGAYLTIIAAATDKMYEKSAAFEGPIYEWPMFKTADSRRRMDWREREISARYVMLSRSRWATRGWTYQEQILCKRAVVFIESGFFWDCHCCVWDGVDLFPRQDFEGIALRADMGQRLNTRSWPDFSLYLDLVCPYNGRQFSYPQDAMLGVTGVLNALDKSFPGGFVYGLPRLFLDHALLWQPFGTGERRVDRSEDVDEAAPLELIAISTGSAQARDMRASLEWRIYETA